jgi:hypothetical protein
LKKKYYKNNHFHVQKRNLICFSWKKIIWLGRIKHTTVKWLVPYFVHFNRSFFEISLTFISPKPSPMPSDVQLLSTRHVTKVHLLQKFLDPQKHTLIDNILPTCGNLSRFSFTWIMCVQREMCIKHDTWLARGLTTYKYENERLDKNLLHF